MQNKDSLYEVDKTKTLEEGIRRFPSIYIEGNAAAGKTTAVEMLQKKHLKTATITFDLTKESGNFSVFCEKMNQVKKNSEEMWIILEQGTEKMSNPNAAFLADYIENMEENHRVILVSREKPHSLLLDLLWKGKMGLVPMKKLLFSLEEVRMLVKHGNHSLNPEALYEKTGGWPGCVSALIHLAEHQEEKKLEELLQSHEIRNYIETRILGDLTAEEGEILSYAAGCPWVNESFLEYFCGFTEAGERLENLQRKGLLQFDAEKHRWKLFSLFRNYITEHLPELGKENEWYEAHGMIAEAFSCVKKAGAEAFYRKMMLKYWNRIYQLELFTEDVLKWKGKTPQECYLRGVYYYRTQQFEKLRKEIGNVQKIGNREFDTREVLINLCYLDPRISLNEWMELAEREYEDGRKFQLYQMLGSSVSYLCGLRDLSGLFACTAKEEKQRAKVWKTVFGEKEWKCYRLARLDYDLETRRKDSIAEKDWYFLEKIDAEQDSWQIHVAKLYLLCKSQKMQPEEIQTDQIKALEEVLSKEESPLCRKLAEAIINIHAPWYGAREKMAKWLRYANNENTVIVNEDNYMTLCCRAKGYLRLNQFDRAEKLLKKLVPYLQVYHRNRFLSELLFAYAVIHMEKDYKGQAIKNAIESFLLCSASRYVRFYTEYGKLGQQVLETHLEWQKLNFPENWSHKKKYHYGNVQRMPWEEYLDTILRNAKKMNKRTSSIKEEDVREHLTMMETIILQDIGRGMSNAEICEELGLKLPTVKGHIYNLYKKLEVNSRGQAMVKGKELGLLE